MLDHLCFSVSPSQFESIVSWYLAALAPLGYSKYAEYPGRAVGLGPSKDDMHFWIGASEEAKGGGFHLAFRASEHAIVDKFHEEAIKAGGKCNGKPGIRTMYNPNYYAAFVLDPLGNNIEVVDRTPKN